MGKVVTSTVMSQAVRCTKCSGLDEAIFVRRENFFSHKNPGEHFALCRRLDSSSRHKQVMSLRVYLNPDGDASGTQRVYTGSG